MPCSVSLSPLSSREKFFSQFFFQNKNNNKKAGSATQTWFLNSRGVRQIICVEKKVPNILFVLKK